MTIHKQLRLVVETNHGEGTITVDVSIQTDDVNAHDALVHAGRDGIASAVNQLGVDIGRQVAAVGRAWRVVEVRTVK